MELCICVHPPMSIDPAIITAGREMPSKPMALLTVLAEMSGEAGVLFIRSMPDEADDHDHHCYKEHE